MIYPNTKHLSLSPISWDYLFIVRKNKRSLYVQLRRIEILDNFLTFIWIVRQWRWTFSPLFELSMVEKFSEFASLQIAFPFLFAKMIACLSFLHTQIFT